MLVPERTHLGLYIPLESSSSGVGSGVAKCAAALRGGIVYNLFQGPRFSSLSISCAAATAAAAAAAAWTLP